MSTVTLFSQARSWYASIVFIVEECGRAFTSDRFHLACESGSRSRPDIDRTGSRDTDERGDDERPMFAVRDVRVLREQRPQSQRAETTVRRRSRSARARRNQRSKTSVKRASRTVRRTCRSIAPLPRRSIRMRRISHSSPPKAIRAGSTSRSSTRGSFRCTAPISNRSHRRRGRRCSAKRRVFLRRRRSGRRMRRA